MKENKIQSFVLSEIPETLENGFTHVAPRDEPFLEPVGQKVSINLLSGAEDFLGPAGYLLAASKTAYRRQNPGHHILFNACIFTKQGEQIWFGDLDLTLNQENLQNMANILGFSFIVTPETPFRFDGLKDVLDRSPFYREEIVQFNPGGPSGTPIWPSSLR
jgi:hypothetical protein